MSLLTDVVLNKTKEIEMELEDKAAVLKLAGFELEIGNNGGWEWVVNAETHTRYRSLHAFKTHRDAYENAWKFIQGDKTLEIINDAWGTK